jgi:TRAP-type mannitol/chloroaromatic compound transport system permease small subunit
LQESVLYMHGLVFLLGAGYTLKEGGHVRIDVFYQNYSQKTKALVDLFGTVFLLIPVCVFIFIISWDYVSVSWRIMEESSQPGGLPFVYISKTFLLLFSVTLILQGVSEALKNILIYQKERTKNKNIIEGIK